MVAENLQKNIRLNGGKALLRHGAVGGGFQPDADLTVVVNQLFPIHSWHFIAPFLLFMPEQFPWIRFIIPLKFLHVKFKSAIIYK